MAQETMKLSVDTGSIEVEVDDRGEVIGKFRFNPTDIDIARRYDQVVKYLDSVTINENSDEKEVLEFTDKLKEQFDYLLNYQVSEALFAKCNPLTPLANGDFYCENVLDGIAGIIEQTMNQRIERKKNKIRKATAKYHK